MRTQGWQRGVLNTLGHFPGQQGGKCRMLAACVKNTQNTTARKGKANVCEAK